MATTNEEKPLKRFRAPVVEDTPLKWGVNEKAFARCLRLINTPLQWGDFALQATSGNRFNGFSGAPSVILRGHVQAVDSLGNRPQKCRVGKTVERVPKVAAVPNTSLKWGVNEMIAKVLKVEISSLAADKYQRL